MEERSVKISVERIEKAIFLFRGQKVMLDRELAALYGIETKALKRAVRRNLTRFPADFMLQIAREDYDGLGRQIGTLKRGEHSKSGGEWA
jgi:hypothetical protein